MYAHRRCANGPPYRTIRELSPSLDFGNRNCGVCKELLTPQRTDRPPGRTDDGKGVAPPANAASADGEASVVLLRNAEGRLYYSCGPCSRQYATFKQVRTFRNCGHFVCSFCGRRAV